MNSNQVFGTIGVFMLCNNAYGSVLLDDDALSAAAGENLCALRAGSSEIGCSHALTADKSIWLSADGCKRGNGFPALGFCSITKKLRLKRW
jgi:hypothetical protein